MGNLNPEISEHSIVLVGTFTPKMFQPIWFEKMNLIAKEEVDSSQLGLVHSTITSFSLSWMNFEVTENRLVVRTDQLAYFEPVRDIVSGILQVTPYYPLRAMGINFSYHIEMANEDKFFRFWSKFINKSSFDNIISDPQLSSITMQGKKINGRDGYNLVKMAPSSEVPNGVFFDINHHNQLAKKENEEIEGPSRANTILAEDWKTSFKSAEDIILGLLNKGTS